MAKTAVELMAERVAKLEKKVKNLSSQPRLANASIEDTSVPIRDQGGLTRASLGRQSDGSHGSHVVVSPAQPTPDAPDLSVGKTGVVAVRSNGKADGPVPLIYGHIEVQAMGPSDADWQVVGTIRDRDGGATTFAADESGTTQVRLVMVGQDRVTRSEASDVSEIEVELPASTSEVQAAQESADGKNIIFYDPDPPAVDGEATGDIFFQVDDVTGVVEQAWRWDGSAWVEQSFGDEVLDSISAGKISAGTIEAAIGIGTQGYIRSTNAEGTMSEMIGAGFRTEAPDGTIIFDSRGGDGFNSTAFGVGATSVGGGSTALGHDATGSGAGSVALGASAGAAVGLSTALGAESVAAAEGSSALGYVADAGGLYSTALGAAATASGGESTAVGVQASATQDDATAVGRLASASGPGSSAFGWGADSAGQNAVALGRSASAGGTASTALGRGATASHNRAAAIGAGATTGANNEGVLGGPASDTGATSTWRVPGDFAVEGVAGGDGLIREISNPVVDSYGHTVESATGLIILGRIAVIHLYISGIAIGSGSQTTTIAQIHSDLTPASLGQWTGTSGSAVGMLSGEVETSGDVSIRWSAGSGSSAFASTTIIYPIA